jgi:hypothetical protein
VQLMKPIREKTKHFFLTANCRCVQDDCALVPCVLALSLCSIPCALIMTELSFVVPSLSLCSRSAGSIFLCARTITVLYFPVR